jgi:hypothetical protein
MDIRLIMTMPPINNAITATPVKIFVRVPLARVTRAMVAAGFVTVKSSSAGGWT